MTANSVVAGLFGLGFILVPGRVVALYTAEASVTIDYVAQLLGGALLSFAIVTWAARNAPDSEARRAILLGLFIGDVVGCVVALIAQLGGLVNAIGWSTVVIYLVLAIGFGYFRFGAGAEAAGAAGVNA
jgi:fucose 4-O-acetylase-like acetyltransferase